MKPDPLLPAPHACLLSNGSYFTFITSAGTGQSRRHGHVVNRWHGDPVEDAQGQFIYLRDLESGALWSAAMQPMKCESTSYRSASPCGTFWISNEANDVRADLIIAVSPHDDLEVRCLKLTNLTGKIRRIEVTSFIETVLTSQGADVGHPAFSKLFVQTSREENALFAERRPRGADETWPCLFHSITGATADSWETDRIRFLGRGRTVANPQAFENEALSGSVGNVLDPCLSLRTIVTLGPNEESVVCFITGIAENKESASSLVGKYSGLGAIDRILVEARKAEESLRREHGIDDAMAAKFQALAAAMHYEHRSLNPSHREASASAMPPVPRDRPTVVACDGWSGASTQDALKARSYWAIKGFFTNFVVLDEAGTNPQGHDDRVFTLAPSTLGESGKSSLLAIAALVVEGSLPEAAGNHAPGPPPRIKEATKGGKIPESESLRFFNGYGGFSEDGSEYVIRLPREGKRPPMPWINVVANEHAGFLVSESGAGCTWARNSQANRLTPWSNEPASDPHGEALYLRDEASGEVWSPLPGPVCQQGDHEVRHGLGATRFLSSQSGIDQDTVMFVPRHDAVKIVIVRLANRSGEDRKLSITSYQRLVMGSLPEARSLIVTRQPDDGSLRAKNPAAGDFTGGIAFAALSLNGVTANGSSIGCDRLGFLGRHGTPANPAALCPGGELDGACGAGLDPCFVQQSAFTLPAGATAECVILLGESMSDQGADQLVARYGDFATARAALTEVQEFWKALTGTIKVTTPSPVLDLMVNGWLPYQTLCCRMWARSAFYQSSGAFGYRDQLQDSGSLLQLDPAIARRQILLHAEQQFAEGDVLHWWHPAPIDRGLRTRFSDDLLWLPFITCDYLRATGDATILDEEIPYLKAAILADGHDENYLTPEPAGESGSLYDHCCRTIDRSLATGAHGLPLMGTGDWNDGMSRVGREGKGESIWVGFFLYRILGSFIPVCESRGDSDRVAIYEEHRTKLLAALNDGGWDREWYRRAYYDNGAPLGSKESDECKIDTLAQSWAILSKAASPDRAALAMEAMERELVSEQEGIIRLLTPPFINTPNDPGYIKGYVAGVRENGGQYTHAACWAVQSIAEHGENNRALRLWEMLAPVSHSLTPEAANLYKVEPYVVAADVYGAPPHIGRGGWTWYTGSSGWMYRVAMESILGLRIEDGATLVMKPCIPDEWPEYLIEGRLPNGSAGYRITVLNPEGFARSVQAVTLDGVEQKISEGIAKIRLPRDGAEHDIRITLG
ncbi:glycosyl transferase [Luteolibacter flavescens]|uniref:Glycosyl transferase n=1 Tax=Luteolibacter flavescens TaxID=1859460 RepID=A0ABT3FRP6_9BACT|nr:glycosyl transferase [Luteolibacter flavescens]MCW1885906.1 glycosyl transferase [Luteolibacter flavescens]